MKAADGFSAAIERNELSTADKGEAARFLAILEDKLGTARFTGDASLEARIDGGPPVHPPGARHGQPGPHTVTVTGPGGTGTIQVERGREPTARREAARIASSSAVEGSSRGKSR